MVLEQPWSKKQTFWVFEKNIFQFCASFWVTKLKQFDEKVRQSVRNYLTQNLGIRGFLENDFGASFSSKTNVQSISKSHFPVFCKFLSDEVEIIFWESETKRSGLFQSGFGQSKLLRKLLWSCRELKNECSEYLKGVFFRFLQIFEWQIWNHFLEKWGKAFKTI